MEILYPTTEYRQPICIALGFFDCVHLGHAALLSKTCELAKKLSAKAFAVTFVNSPYEYIGKADGLIFSFDERIKLFEEQGIEGIVAYNFDKKFMSTDCEAFLNELVERFDLRGVICGHDFTFGCNSAGNASYLADFCRKNSIMCDIISPIELNGDRISSSQVRKYLLDGDIICAIQLLGHPYFIDGTVCHGRGVGKAFDFPTANLKLDKDKLLPKRGVYATVTYVNGKKFRSVTNVGAQPTFGEVSETVETMLCDFDGDLYGKEIRVEFVKRLRDIVRFSSPYELKKQIYEDANWR